MIRWLLRLFRIRHWHEQQWCPRRSESGMGATFPGPDGWSTGHGLVAGKKNKILACTYCGSMRPEDFLARVREGWIVGPTDKSYKAYLARPYTEEEVEVRKKLWLETGIGKVMREQGYSEVDIEAEWQRGTARSYQGADVGKFYFQHLSPEQRQEFIQLYNDKVMNLGYPGYFYTKPFFCVPAGA